MLALSATMSSTKPNVLSRTLRTRFDTEMPSRVAFRLISSSSDSEIRVWITFSFFSSAIRACLTIAHNVIVCDPSVNSIARATVRGCTVWYARGTDRGNAYRTLIVLRGQLTRHETCAGGAEHEGGNARDVESGGWAGHTSSYRGAAAPLHDDVWARRRAASHGVASIRGRPLADARRNQRRQRVPLNGHSPGPRVDDVGNQHCSGTRDPTVDKDGRRNAPPMGFGSAFIRGNNLGHSHIQHLGFGIGYGRQRGCTGHRSSVHGKRTGRLYYPGARYRTDNGDLKPKFYGIRLHTNRVFCRRSHRGEMVDRRRGWDNG